MNIVEIGKVKSGIALVLLLSACGAYAPVDNRPSLLPEAPRLLPPDTGASGLGLAGAGQPRTLAEVAFMKARMNAIQPQSIAEDREYCGYLGLLPNGEYAISGPKRGAPAGCTPDNPPANMRLLASYHTHAAYDARYDSEVPSAADLEGDISEGVNGYIATPGGRLWFNDRAAQTATQLCGIGCLPADPRFAPDPEYPVQQSYTLVGLRQRQN